MAYTRYTRVTTPDYGITYSYYACADVKILTYISGKQGHIAAYLPYPLHWQQKTGVMTNGGLTSLRLRRITSSPSQTLRRPLVRTTDDGRRGECSTLAAVCSGFNFSHFATCTVNNTVVLYAAKPDICPESRCCLPTPLAFDAPVRGIPVGISPSRLVRKN